MDRLSETTAVTVRTLLTERGVRQREVGVVLGIPQSAVSARLAARRPFRLDELGRLADHLDVDVRDLLGVAS